VVFHVLWVIRTLFQRLDILTLWGIRWQTQVGDPDSVQDDRWRGLGKELAGWLLQFGQPAAHEQSSLGPSLTDPLPLVSQYLGELGS